MFSKESIIYLAAMIDGEGSISIELQSPCGSRKTDYYSIRLLIINTNKELMDWLVSNFGGRILARKKIEKRKQCYVWSIFSHDAALLLKQCLPYMINKRKHAEVIIEFMSAKKERTWNVSAELQDHRRFLYQKLKQINKTY